MGIIVFFFLKKKKKNTEQMVWAGERETVSEMWEKRKEKTNYRWHKKEESRQKSLAYNRKTIYKVHFDGWAYKKIGKYCSNGDDIGI